jgi:stage V sporulation protein SpoVS
MRAYGGATEGSFAASAVAPQGPLSFADSFGKAGQATAQGGGQAADAQLDSAWVSQAGNFADNTSSKVAVSPSGTSPAVAVVDGATAADVSVSSAVTVASGQMAGLVARYQGTGDQNLYFGGLYNQGGTYTAKLYKNVGGSWRQLDSEAVSTSSAAAQPWALTFQVVGPSLKLLLDTGSGSGPQVVASAVDGSLTQAGQVGMRAYGGATEGTFAAAAIAPPSPLPFADSFGTAGQATAQGGGQVADGQLDSAWVSQAGSFTTGTNLAVSGSASTPSLVVVNSLTAADVSVSSAVTVASGQMAGLVARYQGTGDQNLYFGGLYNQGGTYTAKLYKNVGGSWSQLDSEAVNTSSSAAQPWALTFQVVGPSLKLLLDTGSGSGPQLVASAVDGSLTQAGQVGMRAYGGATEGSFAASAVAPQGPLSFADNFGTAGQAAAQGGGQAADAQLDSAWVSQAGNFTTGTNQAVASSAAENLATVNGISAADVDLTAVVAVTGNGQSAGLVARYSGFASNAYYYGAIEDVGGNLYARIYVNSGGTTTKLAEALISNGSGALHVRVKGNLLELFMNYGSGDQLLTAVNDSTLTGPGGVGLVGTAGMTFGSFKASAA